MFWGDINHAEPVQMQQSKVAIHFDIDQVQAIRTRQQALRDAADHSYLVGAARITFGELCGWSISGKVIVGSRQVVKPGAIQNSCHFGNVTACFVNANLSKSPDFSAILRKCSLTRRSTVCGRW